MARSVGDIRLDSPPTELDRLIDWFEVVSNGLVLLEEYPIDRLRTALGRFTAAVRAHCRAGTPQVPVLPAPGLELARHLALLESDHQRFESSLEQLWWFFGVVEREDHGGHRQALGQYGRVLAESLRHHLADERRRVDPDTPSPAPGLSAFPGNHN